MGVIIARLVQYVRDVFLATSFTFFFNLTQAVFGRRDHLVNRPSMAVYHLFVRLVAYSSLTSCSTHRILFSAGVAHLPLLSLTFALTSLHIASKMNILLIVIGHYGEGFVIGNTIEADLKMVAHVLG